MKKAILLVFFAALVFSCKPPEARRPVSQETGSFIDESIVRNKKLVAAEEKKIQEIIKKDSLNKYISSPNGFWYYYNKKDTLATKTPEIGDVVEFSYNIKTLDDKIIYSKEELSPKTYRIDKEKIFAGLRQGLKFMHENETVTFLFPSHKAFGFYGDKNKIGRDVPIKSTVTLLNIKSENNSNQNNQ